MATSTGYTATATGTDYWVATYNGDSNNSTVTSGTAAEPVIDQPGQPDDQHQPAAGQRHRRQLDRRQGHGQRRVQPDRHRHLQPVQQLERRPARRCSPTPRPLVRRHGHLDGLHRDGDGHRLLGRHLQRRQQQQLGHQRHRRRAGDHQPGHPGDQHHASSRPPPPSAPRSPTRPPSAAGTTRPAPSPSTCTTTRTAPARRCSPTPTDARPAARPPRAATPRRRRAPTTGWPPTTATSNNSTVTSGTAAEPVTISPATPDDQHQPAAGQRHRRHLDRRQGDGQRRVQPDRHGHLQPVQQLERHRHAAVHRHRRRSSGGMATSTGYTTTATGTDYWVATYNGDSNNSPVTSGTAAEPVTISPATPDDQHQPAAGQRHRRHLDRRQGHGQRRVQPDRHGHLQPLQQLERHRHAAVHRHRDRSPAAWPPRRATPPPRRAPTTGSPPTTATATTTRSPAAPPPSR